MTESLAAYYQQLTDEQRADLKAVAMDMWEPILAPRANHHAASFATLQALNLTVGRAWAIKEAPRTLWTFRQGTAVRRFFSQWHGRAVRSRLDPVKKVAGMLKRHLDGVLRFVKHPITNGVAEGLNTRS